jgi:hypothetical protein
LFLLVLLIKESKQIQIGALLHVVQEMLALSHRCCRSLVSATNGTTTTVIKPSFRLLSMYTGSMNTHDLPAPVGRTIKRSRSFLSTMLMASACSWQVKSTSSLLKKASNSRRMDNLAGTTSFQKIRSRVH